jgi:uncharacterized OB-fold protein
MELTAMPPLADRERIDRVAGTLVGSRCHACAATSWPGRAGCHRCGQLTMEPTSFAPTGSLLTCTTVWIGRPGLEPPYTLGQIKLDDGPLVFAHVRTLAADAVMPVAVRLVVDSADSEVPPFWFEPEEEQ